MRERSPNEKENHWKRDHKASDLATGKKNDRGPNLKTDGDAKRGRECKKNRVEDAVLGGSHRLCDVKQGPKKATKGKNRSGQVLKGTPQKIQRDYPPLVEGRKNKV